MQKDEWFGIVHSSFIIHHYSIFFPMNTLLPHYCFPTRARLLLPGPTKGRLSDA
jgi:hypothetical protein